MITPIRLLALLALTGISFGAAACCSARGADDPMLAVAERADMRADAVDACRFYRQRLASPSERGSEVVSYLANSCGTVLTDLATSNDLDDLSVLHGKLYLERLAELHKATEGLSATYREAGSRHDLPTQTGEFLMARHLGVIHHFASWRAAWKARQAG